jgi:hypothetical protein
MICASVYNAECNPNYFAFPNIKACEAARAALRGQFEFARCERADRVTIEPTEVDPDPSAR